MKVFDTSEHNLSKHEDKLDGRIFTSVFYPRVLRKALVSADAVIGAMQFNTTPKYRVSEDLVKQMKEGSVIIDLNAGQGGCFETTHCTDLNNPVYIKHGIVHYCVPNSPAIVSRTASIALSNNLLPILLAVGDSGGMHNYIKNFRGFRKGVYICILGFVYHENHHGYCRKNHSARNGFSAAFFVEKIVSLHHNPVIAIGEGMWGILPVAVEKQNDFFP